MKYYRTLDRIGDGDCFEGKIYTDKNEAIKNCQADWEALSAHDKARRSLFYVAEYDSEEDAEEAWCGHNVAYDTQGTWADNLLNYTGLNRKQFCMEYNIPYGTFEKWQYGTRECPEYVKDLLDRVVRLDF